MNIEIIRGVLIPFLGTVLGSACVFFLRKNIGDLVQRALTGFAAGVMVAASIWSLLIPAMEQSAAMGKWSFVPAVAGFWVGILFLLLLDHVQAIWQEAVRSLQQVHWLLPSVLQSRTSRRARSFPCHCAARA